MANERRNTARLVGPFEGSWDGAASKRDCRITDLSLGGCFIDAFASEPIGTRVQLSITLQGRTYRVPAEVVYADRVQGFAVKFLDDKSPDSLALADVIAAMAT